MNVKPSPLAASIRHILQQRRQDEFAQQFYDNLMARDERITALFQETNFTAQRHKLFFALMMMIEASEQPGMFRGVVEEMGQRHQIQYGVTPDMLHHFKDAMLETLPAMLEDNWTGELEEMWSVTLDRILFRFAPADD